MSHSGDVADSGSSAVTSIPAPAIARLRSAVISALLVHAPAARHVDQVGGSLHLRKCVGVDDFRRLRVERTGERHEIGLGKKRTQRIEAVHRVRRRSAGGGIALDADDAESECLRELREPAADAAQADDDERLAAELVFARSDLRIIGRQ
jgi:hypothetical protein